MILVVMVMVTTMDALCVLHNFYLRAIFAKQYAKVTRLKRKIHIVSQLTVTFQRDNRVGKRVV